MAAFLPHVVDCSCGGTLVIDVAESVNVGRMPHVRDEILAGTLHRATCPACGVPATVEKSFFYADPGRNTFYRVQPRNQRHHWQSAAEELGSTLERLPEALAPKHARILRVVYGMDELREKLVAQDAGLDDRIVELLKVFLTHEHPVLLGRARLRLRLDAMAPEELVFVAAYEHHGQRFEIRLPCEAAYGIAKRSAAMKEWVYSAHKSNDLFESGAHWVNLWKWSPQPRALRELEVLARKARHHEAADLRTKEAKWTLDHIPRGSHLPWQAKKNLASLFELSKARGWSDVEEHIFEVRFDTNLANDWATNSDRTDIATLWQLFHTLPSNNVEGNTKIHEITTGKANGSTYDPGSREIFIAAGDIEDKKEFPFTVRHEVGHAVHEKRKPLVDAWLASHFGWKTFDATDDDAIDAWIDLMKGWRGINASQRRDVRRQIKHAVGSRSGKWTPAPLTPLNPRSHPWNQEDFPPRRALDLSSGNPRLARHWYDDFENWHEFRGHRFSCNFYYAELMVVPVKTLKLVAKMKRPYASMSPAEFFAEMYAKYYDGKPATRTIFPQAIQDWFREHVEERVTAAG